MLLFFALLFLSIAIAGFCAFVIFWPLALVHLRERHPGIATSLGDFAFLSPQALAWLLLRRYAKVRDRQFTGLATPAWVSLCVILLGLGMGGLLWLISALTPGVGA